MRSAMSRAKPISWVAMTIVMPRRGELADDVEHLGHQLRVERARDLVEQQDVGLHGERTDDRDPLLLTARQPVGHLVALVRQPEACQELGRLGLRLPRGDAQGLPRGERHVVQHGQVREEVERLEDDADPPPDAVEVDAVAP